MSKSLNESLLARDGLFLAAMFLIGLAAGILERAAFWVAMGLLLIRTCLKPAKTWWQREAMR